MQDWAPEYRPHSIVPPTTIKGDRLRKTFMISGPMILKARANESMQLQTMGSGVLCMLWAPRGRAQ
jgi:hypothetical protein